MPRVGGPHTPSHHSNNPSHNHTDPHGSNGKNRSETHNPDGSPIQRDAKGGVDNNKNGKADGSGIDINGMRPDKDHPIQQAAFDEQKQLARDKKMDALNAKQELASALADIKQWSAQAGDIDKEF